MRFFVRRTAAIALGLTLVSGCSVYPKLVILNNSGSDLVVQVYDRETGQWDRRDVQIGHGERRKLIFGTVVQPDGRIRVARAGCRHEFALPEGRSAYSPQGSSLVAVVQIEPDLGAYLRPDGHTALPRAQLDALQKPGYPARPVRSDCS